MPGSDDDHPQLGGIKIKTVQGWRVDHENCIVLEVRDHTGRLVSIRDRRDSTLFAAVALFKAAVVGCHEGCCDRLMGVLLQPHKVVENSPTERELYDPDEPAVTAQPTRVLLGPQKRQTANWLGGGVISPN